MLPWEQVEHSEKYNFVRESSLFQAWSADEVNEVVKLASREEYLPGHTVVQEGDEADSFYLVKKGLASVIVNVNGLEVVAGQISPWDIFGEMALLDPLTGKTPATIRADVTMVSAPSPIC